MKESTRFKKAIEKATKKAADYAALAAVTTDNAMKGIYLTFEGIYREEAKQAEYAMVAALHSEGSWISKFE